MEAIKTIDQLIAEREYMFESIKTTINELLKKLSNAEFKITQLHSNEIVIEQFSDDSVVFGGGFSLLCSEQIKLQAAHCGSFDVLSESGQAARYILIGKVIEYLQTNNDFTNHLCESFMKIRVIDKDMRKR